MPWRDQLLLSTVLAQGDVLNVGPCWGTLLFLSAHVPDIFRELSALGTYCTLRQSPLYFTLHTESRNQALPEGANTSFKRASQLSADNLKHAI